jgi:crossover junction endodeoxyribonuclease RuvC
MVVEDVYVLKAYPKAAIQLGAVRGVVLLAAEHHRIRVCEIKPTEVKSALTGNGRASKAHVGTMIRRILNFDGGRTSDHVSDAMALAVTGLSRSGLLRW